MYYVYDKKMDSLMRMMSKPTITRGGPFELLTEDEFNKRLAEQERGLFVGDDDLSAGTSSDDLPVDTSDADGR